jgi:hypothetical protein
VENQNSPALAAGGWGAVGCFWLGINPKLLPWILKKHVVGRVVADFKIDFFLAWISLHV